MEGLLGISDLSEIFKGNITSNSNLNDLGYGTYAYSATSLPQNTPTKKSGSVSTFNLNSTGNVKIQRVLDGDGSIYVRTRYNVENIWSEWIKIV